MWCRTTFLPFFAGFVAASVILLGACGGGASDVPVEERVETPTGDGTPPEVVSSNPAAGTGGVRIGSTITLTYSETMDTASGEAAFAVAPSLAGEHTWATGGTEQTFTPASSMAPGTIYTVTIGVAASDTAGNPLAEAYSFTFTTGGTGENVWGGSLWGFDGWRSSN